MAVHNFKASLLKGQKGEELFCEAYPDATRTDGRRSDFVLASGTRLELKTDSYPMAATPNLFIELFSDLDKAKPGGPAQALSHGSTAWAYLYIHDGIMLLFDTANLLRRIEDLMKSGAYPIKYIKNVRWTTAGVAIPRSAVSDLYTEIDLRARAKSKNSTKVLLQDPEE